MTGNGQSTNADFDDVDDHAIIANTWVKRDLHRSGDAEPWHGGFTGDDEVVVRRRSNYEILKWNRRLDAGCLPLELARQEVISEENDQVGWASSRLRQRSRCNKKDLNDGEDDDSDDHAEEEEEDAFHTIAPDADKPDILL